MSYEIICEDSLSVGPIINGSGEEVRCVDRQRKKSLIEIKITSKQTIPVSLFSTTDKLFVVDLKISNYVLPTESTFRYPATLNHSKWMYDRSSLKFSKPVSDLVVPLF